MTGPLAQGMRLGPYEIGALIGSGGMGRVYRARDPRLARNVAIKTLSDSVAADPEALHRFEAEARAAGTLDHPNLLVVFDVGREAGVSYIVSELLEGETLYERLLRGPLPSRLACDCAVQIARGLAAAHMRGVVHRDLKPANLFLTRDRRVKILDFGVAKLTAKADGDAVTKTAATQTIAGVIVGTASYMAPEQILGDQVDHRADIFALGLVMHEMLAGARPFQRETAPQTLSAILTEDPVGLPPGVNPGLTQIVRRCLEKSPDERFHSAHDLALALDLVSNAAADGAPMPVAAPTDLPRRRVLLRGASALGLAAAGFVGGVLVGGDRVQQAGPPFFQRLTFRRGLIRSARLAPDGQTILYGALWDGDFCRVYSTRVGDPESSALDLPDANVLAVSKTGELALCLGANLDGVFTYGTLARVSISGGAPRELVEDVKFADWSPDGAALAIIRRVDGIDQLEYPSGNVLFRPSAREGTGLGFARIAPDGRRVAFIHYLDPQSLTGAICVTDANGRVDILTDEYVNIHGLAWSGGQIWYSASDDRPLFRSLYVVSPGSAPQIKARMPVNVTVWDAAPGRLLIAQTDDRAVMIGRMSGDQSERDLSWLDASWVADLSRDGRLLLFSETGQGVRAESAAYLRGTDGSTAVRLGSGQPLALSPDTRWALILVSEQAAGGSGASLEIVPTGAGPSRRLSGDHLKYFAARWLPDGQRIAVVASEHGSLPRVYMMDLQGRSVPVTPESVGRFVMSPDGTWIAARDMEGAIRLYPVDGGEARTVPASTGAERLIEWIDDGLLVTGPGDPGSPRGEVYLIDPATGRQRSWSNILPRDAGGLMLLGTFCATPDGRARVYTWHRALCNLYIADGVQ